LTPYTKEHEHRVCGIRNLRYVCIQKLNGDIPTYKKCTVGVLLILQKKFEAEKIKR